jgi:hypothetical protein
VNVQDVPAIPVLRLETPLVYAGIGSRQAPPLQVARIERLAQVLARHGWTLRTGLAEGADQAFYRGAHGGRGRVELYLPWPSFNHEALEHRKDVALWEPSGEARAVAARFHDGWERLSAGARALHARNSHQVLGRDLQTPAGLIICWTRDASRNGLDPGTGGTGQALRIAAGYGVPVLNIARPEDAERIRAMLAQDRGQVTA